jgi:3-methylfumaryl-CoA hydratase
MTAAATIDIAELRKSIGRKLVEKDEATAAPVRCLAATFDRQEAEPVPGAAVPPGWHILYFLAAAPRSALAADGLPVDWGVLPKMPLPRRMYAGSRITFHDDIRIGDALTRETELLDIQARSGSTGQLVFATQARRISTPRGPAVTEEYDGAFREAVQAGQGNVTPKREAPPEGLPWQRTISVDVPMLFRFSALTFNPHRIHYDRPYAMGTEGYPGLVVHGPFSQTCLFDFIRDHTPGMRIVTYTQRARAPLYDTAPFTLVGRPTADGMGAQAWAVTPEGTIAMQVEATLRRV